MQNQFLVINWIPGLVTHDHLWIDSVGQESYSALWANSLMQNANYNAKYDLIIMIYFLYTWKETEKINENYVIFM